MGGRNSLHVNDDYFVFTYINTFASYIIYIFIYS